ncbi:MAG: cytochrome-c peroxidase [Nitrospina sp.]|jgi:cytochrome c peroxidase|nr:cytochrome-c peroxidase [Nitrospina sp.]MBT4374924.1 cytochrome-c peroxidase [Nitrospina sp.]MBT6596048.1 cytochrome-c peroxidase [Nitrospina sp.]MBT7934926.1 cytochrome-c peroxidase [Nitrospina sp.]
MRLLKRSLIFLLIFAPLTASAGDFEDLKEFYDPLPKMKYPTDNPWSKEKENLGKILYFDPRLSGSNWISCATCHNPGLGWGDGLPRPFGHGQKELDRHSPTIINSGYFESQFWDGRAKSLEEQALGPIGSQVEMKQNLGELEKELDSIPGYVRLFKKVFPKEGISEKTIAKAIGTYERSIVSKNAPYDRYFEGDKNAMSTSALNGMKLFFGKAKCSICHNGPAFTDSGFHNIGVKQHGPLKEDLGRYNVTKDDFDKGAFKTPGLRHITRSAPYMHDGSEDTLEQVIGFYDRGGDIAENRSPFITPLGLTVQEKKDLVEFMNALEGEPLIVSFPEFPPSHE